ncbi:MAG: hypothetical protein RLN60_03455 [Phycisphaerales bacterium]
MVLAPWQLALFWPFLVAVIFLTYTPLNLAILCTSGAMVGSYASRTRLIRSDYRSRKDEVPIEEERHEQQPGSGESVQERSPDAQIDTANGSASVDEQITSLSGCQAAVHGLCVYLALYAGLIVIQGTPEFDTQESGQYERLAAFATLLSVFAGANTEFLQGLRERFGRGGGF